MAPLYSTVQNEKGLNRQYQIGEDLIRECSLKFPFYYISAQHKIWCEYSKHFQSSTFYYRPQGSCGKLMFSQASVILSTGGCLPDTLPGRHPRGRHPRGRHPPWADTPHGQTPSRADSPRADGYCSGRYASYWNAF